MRGRREQSGGRFFFRHRGAGEGSTMLVPFFFVPLWPLFIAAEKPLRKLHRCLRDKR